MNPTMPVSSAPTHWPQRTEEEKQAPAAPSTSSSSGALSPAIAPAPKQLPQTLSLDDLAALSPLMKKTGIRATVAQVRKAAGEHDFFALRTLLGQTIATEYAEKRYDFALRNEFFHAFTYLQNALKLLLSELKEGKGEFEKLSEQQRKELELFITEGRGGESVQVFAKVPLTLNPQDPDYASRIMNFANNKWHFRKGDFVPGMTTPFAEKKGDIRLGEELLICERAALRQKTLSEALANFAALSDRIAPRFEKYGDSARIFLRGMLGAGKTYFLEKVLGVPEEATACADAVKKHLGGNLAHHESVSIHDALSEPRTTKEIRYLMSIKTNVRQSDNEGRGNSSGLCLSKDGRVHIIYDLAISLEEARQRIAERAKGGVRAANEQEIAGSYEDSTKNRPAVIKAALDNEKIFYHLYHRGEQIAWIQGKQLFVTASKQQELAALRSQDPYLDEALKNVPLEVVS